MPHLSDNPAEKVWETLKRESRVEIKIRRSVFIGLALRLADPSEFRPRLADVRLEHGGANHCCHAFRLIWPKFEEYCSDDGEPAGSSGRPILNQMRRGMVDQGLTIVVRYFGGIKLGIPGLIDAYGEAARLALEVAGRTSFVPMTSLRIDCPLVEIGRLHGELAHMGFPGEHIDEVYEENGNGFISLRLPWDGLPSLESRLDEWRAMGRILGYSHERSEMSS